MTLPFPIADGASFTGENVSMLLLIVKATLILVGALGITLAMQRASAGARHLVWLITLGALLLVPALAAWSPLHLRILPALSAVNAPESIGTVPPDVRNQASTHAPTLERTSVQVPAMQRASAPPSATARAVAWIGDASPFTLVLSIWLVVALAVIASLAYAALSLRRIVRNSVALAGPEWLDTIWEISDRIGLETAPRLLQSRETKMPFACGIFHPTIVLPLESEGWSRERRTAVLLHELAHVRRNDLFGHTVGRIACAVYWFHPLVWTAAKRLRSESERACDDLALMCGTRAADYAEHLLDIVTSVRGDSTPMVALAMARRKEFEGRMLAILDPQLTRSSPNRWKAGALVGSLGVLAILVGAAAPARRSAPVAAPHVVKSNERVSPRDAQQGVTSGVHASAKAAVPRVGQDVPTSDNPNAALRDAASKFGTQVATSALNIAGAALPGSNANMNRRVDGPEGRSGIVVADPEISLDPSFNSKTPDERVDLLAKVLGTDTSPELRRTAAWGLAKYSQNPVASAALNRALLHDASARVRETAAWALGHDPDSGNTGATGLATALRSDASDSVRATAAWSLGHVGDKASEPTLVAAVSDKSAIVREKAVWALGTVRPTSAPAALIARLRDEDPDVRQLTAWALFRIRDTTAIPALQAALRTETSKDIQVDYVRALGAMGDQALSAVRGLLESPDPKIKEMAVDVLAGGRGARPWPWPWPEPRPFP
ncbi:MAG: M56 family metallopeptidase [Gemmatimonadaceae bacterium]